MPTSCSIGDRVRYYKARTSWADASSGEGTFDHVGQMWPDALDSYAVKLDDGSNVIISPHYGDSMELAVDMDDVELERSLDFALLHCHGYSKAAQK